MSSLKALVRGIGVPQLIVGGFFLILLVTGIGVGLDPLGLLSDCIARWGMFSILTLAMVPAIQCGIGPNFGIGMGVVGGLMGAVMSIELRITENKILAALGPFAPKFAAILFAMLLGAVMATAIGYVFGILLNNVKGSEMMVTTYIGFSIIAFMNIIWTILPVTNGELVFATSGQGLRTTISLSSTWGRGLSDFLSFSVGKLTVPTGMLLFCALMCAFVWLFMRSKTGVAMSAAGANPAFARASGIDVNRMRLIGTIISSVIGAVGIIVYSQGFSFVQLYNAPQMIGFNAVASVLIGGATIRKARITHVVLGTFLFQGSMALGLAVANKLMPGTSLSEIMRLVISNGIILYALTQVKGGRNGA